MPEEILARVTAGMTVVDAVPGRIVELRIPNDADAAGKYH
jgi:hypothetical protein